MSKKVEYRIIPPNFVIKLGESTSKKFLYIIGETTDTVHESMSLSEEEFIKKVILEEIKVFEEGTIIIN